MMAAAIARDPDFPGQVICNREEKKKREKNVERKPREKIERGRNISVLPQPATAAAGLFSLVVVVVADAGSSLVRRRSHASSPGWRLAAGW